MSAHKWHLCSMCGPTIICGTCGNNGCNGARGELPDGSPCPDCEASSKLHDEFLETQAGKVWAEHSKNLTIEMLNNEVYVDRIEWFLHKNHPEILKKMWATIDLEDPTVRTKRSKETEEYLESTPEKVEFEEDPKNNFLG